MTTIIVFAGGHLGLWIGISAVTIFEVIGFFILLFQKHCVRWRLPNKAIRK